MDFADIQALDHLNAQELAELLYMGHMKQPLQSPFCEIAYLVQNDGWGNRLYLREFNQYAELLGNLIPYKMKALKRRKIAALTREVAVELFEKAGKGLVSGFDTMRKYERSVEIPYFVFGSYIDFDYIYNNRRCYMNQALESGYLEHKQYQ